MIPAKKLLNTLTEHWGVLELLFKRFKMADFSLKDVQNAIKQKQPSWSNERIYKETNRLLNQDIIIPLAKSSQLEINRAIADFATFLLQEEHLGLAQEISVLVDDLARLGNRLAKAGEIEDYDELRRFSRIMDDRVRKIMKLFAHIKTQAVSSAFNVRTVDYARVLVSTLRTSLSYQVRNWELHNDNCE